MPATSPHHTPKSMSVVIFTSNPSPYVCHHATFTPTTTGGMHLCLESFAHGQPDPARVEFGPMEKLAPSLNRRPTFCAALLDALDTTPGFKRLGKKLRAAVFQQGFDDTIQSHAQPQGDAQTSEPAQHPDNAQNGAAAPDQVTAADQVTAPKVTRNPAIKMLSDREDVSWLCETHLKGLNPPTFASFELVGNEDCPLRLSLYAHCRPLISDVPIAVYSLGEDGEYKPTSIAASQPQFHEPTENDPGVKHNWIAGPHTAMVYGKLTGLSGCAEKAACPRAAQCLRADPRLKTQFNLHCLWRVGHLPGDLMYFLPTSYKPNVA